MARRLFVNVDSSRLVSGFENGSMPALDNLFQADNADYELYFLQEPLAGSRRFEVADFSTHSIKLHIGAPPPSTVSAYVTAETWTNLPAVISPTVTRAITGGGGVSEQQLISFSPEANDGTFSITFPSQQLTFTSVTAGIFTTSGAHGLSTLQPWRPVNFGTPSGFSNGQTLYVAAILSATQFQAAALPTVAAASEWSATTAGTGYTITATTPALSARSTPIAIQNTIEQLFAIGPNNISVTGQTAKSYRLSFRGEKGGVTLPLISVTSAMSPLAGKSGTINFNTSELSSAISASAFLDAVLEIEATDGAKVETLLQVPVTLRNDLISSSSPVATSTVSAAASFLIRDNTNAVWSISIDSDGVLTATKQ